MDLRSLNCNQNSTSKLQRLISMDMCLGSFPVRAAVWQPSFSPAPGILHLSSAPLLASGKKGIRLFLIFFRIGGVICAGP
jgi:hypothetical protein